MGLTHHNGLSVYGSGIAYGQKGKEVTLFDCSGVQKAGFRWDAGETSFSGWLKTSVSTKLSSVLYAHATPKIGGNQSGLGGVSSGFITQANAGWSGHMLDFTTFVAISGGAGFGCLTSGGTSSTIRWFAYGT